MGPRMDTGMPVCLVFQPQSRCFRYWPLRVEPDNDLGMETEFAIAQGHSPYSLPIYLTPAHLAAEVITILYQFLTQIP